MTAFKIDVNVEQTQQYLNQLSRATVTRIRRCAAIKRVALQKIREDSPEARVYGFKHLEKVIELQIASYPRYIINIERFLAEVKSTKEIVASLEPLDKGFFSKIKFSNSKNNLEFDVALTEEKFELIKKKADVIYEICTAQRKLLKPSMTGNEEANFREFITLEVEKSEELIKEVNKCMDIILNAVNNMGICQIRFISFLEKCKRKKFSNISEDFQVFCDKIEKNISVFYAFKTYIQISGLLLGVFASSAEMKMLGAAIFGSSWGVDAIMDFVASLPAQRRITKKIIYKIKVVFYKEEQKQKELTAEILASVQRMPSEVISL